MVRLLPFALLIVLFAASAHSAEVLPDTLAFELPSKEGWFVGWGGGPRETQFIDSTVVHGGRYAARMERRAGSPSNFSAVTRGIPITFSGKTIELRGWLKMQDVEGGFAGLWMREDSKEKPTLQFDNMREKQLAGTRDWTQYSIVLPLDEKANMLYFGALISATGTIWADDFELLVDGKPLAEAPPREHVETAIEKDHEFDAGSKIDAARLSRTQIQNLAVLAKVWGFVKYHHPRIVAGEVSWDYELFRVMPGVLGARNSKDAQAVMVAWVDRIGRPSPCTTCATPPDSACLSPDIDWIQDRKRLGETLTMQLADIHRNRSNTPAQHYVSFVRGDRNPVFANERRYRVPVNPDPGYRLLALFRFWNIIEYWFPYRDLIDEDWDGVLEEFMPRVMMAADENEYVLAMMALTARIDDGHGMMPAAWKRRPPAGDCRLAVSLRHVNGQFVVVEYMDSQLAATTGLEIGDIITSIDGRPVKKLVKEVGPYYGASNDEGRLRVLGVTMTNGPCGDCNLEVKRDGKTIQVKSQRHDPMTMDWGGPGNDPPGPTFRKLSDDVAYVTLSSIKASDTASFIDQAAGTQYLIIDIRNYPNEFVPFALGQHLVSKPTPFVCFTHGDATNPGAMLWTETLSVEPKAPRYQGKVAVLVDDESVSQSEYTAMAFRAAGATIIGSTTAGADGNVTRIPLPGGLESLMSGIGVFYPDRKPTQQVGIMPDVVARPTAAGIRDGHDEVLEAAIRHLTGREVRVSTR